jgi:alpha-galactosidase
VGGIRIARRAAAQAAACAALSLQGLGGLHAASAAEAEWTLSTKDTEIKIGIRQDAGTHDDTGAHDGTGSRDDADAILALHTAGTLWEWVQTPSVQELPKTVAQGAAVKRLHWTYSGASQDRERRTLCLIFKNASPALELKSYWKTSPGLGPVEHWMMLKNASADRVTIGAQASLSLKSLALPAGHYVESTQVRRGGSNAQVSGGVLSRPVGQYWSAKVPSRPSDGGGGSSTAEDLASEVPFLNLQVDRSHGLYLGWQFSAVGEILGSSTGTTVDLAVGVAQDFKTDVLAGEEFLIPPAFIGTYAGDQSEGAYSVYRYIQDSLLPRRSSAQPYPTLVYGYYFDGNKPGTQTESDVLASARLAHELGFETYLADAMWFPDTGDWRWDPQRFPHGSKPLADYLHANGMKFALWMAWTLASDSGAPGALNFRQHPQWFTRVPAFDKEGGINWNAQIDVGNDAARRWVEQATQRVVRDNQVDYLKTDFSPISVTSMAQHTHGQNTTDVSYWSTLGYYDIQNQLIEKFPNLILEGCSGGGTIKDFGDIAHVHYIVGTDTLSAMADRQSIYDASYMFPPSSILLYTYERIYSDVSDAPEPYLWRSGMMGAWDLALTDSKNLTDEQRKTIRRSTDIYKSWIRPVLQDAHVHRILARPDGVHWDGMFYWNAGIKKGTAYIFRPNSDKTHQLIFLSGLDPKKTYEIHGEDASVQAGTFSGDALMNQGMDVRLPDKFTSDLLYVAEAT